MGVAWKESTLEGLRPLNIRRLAERLPTASKLWGQVAPTAPPPPGSRVPGLVL